MPNLNVYKCHGRGKDYKVHLVQRVSTLGEILRSFDRTDLSVYMYAVFKEGILPKHECLSNKFKLTHSGNGIEIDYVKFLKKCWYTNIFDLEEVNGIYITNEKISVWLNDKCYKIKALKGYKTKFTPIKAEPDIATLDQGWTIGFFHFPFFKSMEKVNGRDRFFKTHSEEQLGRLIKKKSFHMHNADDRIFLTSNILSEEKWRVAHQNNRFIFSRVSVDLETANKILLKFALNLVLTIFPTFPNIYLAFCYYGNDTLEIGIYLSGNEKLNIDNKYSADEGAILVGHKMKELLLEECDPESDICVTITNATPSNNTDFTNLLYEYRTYMEV